jgi:hemin uptake protein HemP
MQLRVVRKLKREGTARAMSQPPRAPRPDDVVGETTDIVPSVDSVTLMKGRRELIIRHGADTYRLRITASNKLILTK